MTDRNDLAQEFLTASGWKDAKVSILAGDASNRKYFRVKNVAGLPDVVLMDSPTERGEDVRPFVKVAEYLTENGLSAPEILAQDIGNGFLLLEDLGDDLFSTICARTPNMEQDLYQSATDALLALHNAPTLPLDIYTPDLMANLAAQSVDWYAFGSKRQSSLKNRSAICDAMRAALVPFADEFSVTILRDYHAQNLLWLPDRAGASRVGLLDFQDAMIGHPTYDLVSLLEDARRDVSPATRKATLEYFINQSDADPEKTIAAYTAMGAQRNLRILMVFARLSLHFGKPDYVDLIPRTWAHLQRNLAHPDLVELREAVMAILPEPTTSHLSELKEKCGTHLTR